MPENRSVQESNVQEIRVFDFTVHDGDAHPDATMLVEHGSRTQSTHVQPISKDHPVPTNEELAVLIQGGRKDLVTQLWSQVLPFITMMAKRQMRRQHSEDKIEFYGTEVDDLIQSAFIGFMEAVQAYDPASGYTFITFLNRPLKTAFAECFGYRTGKQAADPIRSAASLDLPLSDDSGAGTLEDLQASPVDQMGELENRLFNDQLHTALETALASLPEAEASVLREHYFSGRPLSEIASRSGLSREEVRHHESAGLHGLRRSSRTNGLRQYIDLMSNFYHGSAETVVIRRERLAAEYRYEKTAVWTDH